MVNRPLGRLMGAGYGGRRVALILCGLIQALATGCGQEQSRGSNGAAIAGQPIQGEALMGPSAEAFGSAPGGSSGAQPGTGAEPPSDAGLELAQLPAELRQRWGLDAAEPAAGHRQIHASGIERPATLPADVAVLAFPDLKSPHYRPRALLEPEQEPGPLSASAMAQAGRRVAIAGYPLPYDLRSDGLHALLLTPAPMGCCWGSAQAGLDAQVEVELDPAGPRDLSILEPRWLIGTFEAGEERDAYGFVRSIFRLRSARVWPQ
jgi:hypothetical protein